MAKMFGLTILVAALPAAAFAQDVSSQFRLAPATGNVQGCTAADSAMQRVHTFTLKGDKAEIRSSGGINDRMKPVRPGVYSTTYPFNGTHLDVLVDRSTPPGAVTVSNKNIGCSWSATLTP